MTAINFPFLSPRFSVLGNLNKMLKTGVHRQTALFQLSDLKASLKDQIAPFSPDECAQRTQHQLVKKHLVMCLGACTCTPNIRRVGGH